MGLQLFLPGKGKGLYPGGGRTALPEICRRITVPDLWGKPDLQEVTEDLKLANAYKDYPFMVSWSSTDQDRVSSRGKVNRKGLEDEGQWVTLHALVREVDTGLEQELTLKVF